jgi:parvulin-like peptidyl-prolyl isomerase
MKRLLLAAALFALVAVPLTATACGGNEVPAGAIAAVGDGVVTQAQFDDIMAQAKASYASEPTAPAFPEEGTAQYNQLVAAIVSYLVQNELIAQKAKELDVTVSDKDVQDRLAQYKQAAGGEKKFNKLLKQRNMTLEQLIEQVKAGMLQDAVKQKVYADVKISDEKVKAYYDDPANLAQFKQGESRDTRHVLVKTKAEAAKVSALLAADPSDANWAKVAKKYSTDQASKASGGSLGAVTKGTMVPLFEKAVWNLDVNQVSAPVKTQFGWHVIEVTKVNPAKTQTFDEAKEQIRQMLLYQEQATAWTKWLEQSQKDADVVYAAGFDPDKLTAPATPAAQPSPSASATN